MPRGLSNKIAQGESPLQLIIHKAPPCPGRGVVGLCIEVHLEYYIS